jgi:hypothetical protein
LDSPIESSSNQVPIVAKKKKKKEISESHHASPLKSQASKDTIESAVSKKVAKRPLSGVGIRKKSNKCTTIPCSNVYDSKRSSK